MRKFAVILGTLASAVLASAATLETDWATFRFPDEWNWRAPGDRGFDVEVTLKPGAPVEGNWLQPHLHWMKTAGYGGFQSWQSPVRKPVVGKPYKFHYRPNGAGG